MWSYQKHDFVGKISVGGCTKKCGIAPGAGLTWPFLNYIKMLHKLHKFSARSALWFGGHFRRIVMVSAFLGCIKVKKYDGHVRVFT